MRRALITVAIFFVVSAAVVAQDVASTRTVTSGDNPFVLVDRFIDTFYPKLSDFGGEIVLRATHAKGGGALLAALSAEFRICATSGVPGQTYRATAPPSCGSPSEPDLKMRVYFASADGHRTIESVYVGQKAVLQKQEKLKKLGSLKGTSEPERLLENVGATFGPSNREGLVGRIPTSKVEEFTGCVLDKNTARFVFDSEAARWAVEASGEALKTSAQRCLSHSMVRLCQSFRTSAQFLVPEDIRKRMKSDATFVQGIAEVENLGTFCRGLRSVEVSFSGSVAN